MSDELKTPEAANTISIEAAKFLGCKFRVVFDQKVGKTTNTVRTDLMKYKSTVRGPRLMIHIPERKRYYPTSDDWRDWVERQLKKGHGRAEL